MTENIICIRQKSKALSTLGRLGPARISQLPPCFRYLTQAGLEECTEEGRKSVNDITKVALDVSFLFGIVL